MSLRLITASVQPTQPATNGATVPARLSGRPYSNDSGLSARTESRYDRLLILNREIDMEMLENQLLRCRFEFDRMPMAGLGFALNGGNWWPANGAAGWTKSLTYRPWLDVGVRFAAPDLGRLLRLSTLLRVLDQACPYRRLLKDWPALPLPFGIPPTRFAGLLPMLPTLVLPASEEPMFSFGDVCALLVWLRGISMDPNTLANPRLLEAWLRQPRPAPRPYRLPQCEGDVTRADVTWFFPRRFHALAVEMGKRLGWKEGRGGATAPATQANALASDLLGIPVDLRAGYLVRKADVEKATVGDAVTRRIGNESLQSRLERHIERHLHRVGTVMPGGGCGDPDGAAWSCQIAELMSAPELWSPEPSPAQ